MQKFNKGEWSELYVFVKLLSEGKIHYGDELFNVIPDKYFGIDRIIKNSKDGDKLYSIGLENIEVDNVRIDRQYLSQLANEIFGQILTGRKTFEINDSDGIKKILLINRFSEPSASKIDLKLSLVDIITETSNVYGFSIKTKYTGKSTLVNASGKNTGFKYKILNFNSGAKDEINKINGPSKINDRVKKIIELGGEIRLVGPVSGIYKSNLKLVDSNMHKIIGELLLSAYIGNQKLIKKSLETQSFTNFYLNNEEDKNSITHKIKNFLKASALGLKTGSKWDGSDEVDGGIIVVKITGEILGYFLFSLSKFKEYLWQNTYFETPSTTRHKFGFVYEEKSEFYFDLNLQVRFT